MEDKDESSTFANESGAERPVHEHEQKEQEDTLDTGRMNDSLSAMDKQYAALPQELPRRIHILGTGSVGKFVAHSLRGLPNPPPVTLILHRYQLLQAWEASSREITLHDSGHDVKCSGFDVELAREVRREHGVLIREDDSSSSTTGQRPHQAAKELAAQQGGLSNYKPLRQSGHQGAHAFSDEPIHNLIVTTKTFNTVAALLPIKHRLSSSSTICLLQNGMGVVEELNSKLFPDPAQRPNYIQGIVTHGVNVPPNVAVRDPFYIVHAGHGTVALGLLPRGDADTSPSARARNNASELNDTGLWAPSSRYLLRTLTRSPVLCAVGHTPTELLQLQLEKLAVNSVLNPLTVLLDARNGYILYNFAITRTMRLMLAEASLVIRNMPELRGLANVQSRFSSSRLETLCVGIADKTRDNISSMLADVRGGRQTEVEYINGYIVKRGEEQGIKCLVNYAIMNTVIGKAAITQNEARDEVPLEGKIDLNRGL